MLKERYTLPDGKTVALGNIRAEWLKPWDRDPIKGLVYALRADLQWQGYPTGTDIVRFTKAELIAYAAAMASGATQYNAGQAIISQTDQLPVTDPDAVPDFKGESNQPEIDADEDEPATDEDSDAARKLAALRELLGGGPAKIDQKAVEQIVEGKLNRTVEALNTSYAGFTKAIGELVNETIAASVAAEYERLLASQVKRIEIVRQDGVIHKVGASHKQFELLYRYVEAGLREDAPEPAKNIMLVGPAGAGKTYVFRQIAEALGVAFRFNGALDSKYDLMGYRDANGRYVETEFYRTYCAEYPERAELGLPTEGEGGIFLFDELDASSQPATLAFNAALANAVCDFPIGNRKRHKRCVIVASCNVWDGPTSDYVGRSKQDAAFTNRFGAKIHWQYDEALEAHLAGDDKWTKFVQKCRANVAKAGVQRIISPRASEAGAFYLRCGIAWDDVARDCVRQGLPDEKWNLLTGGQI